MAITIKGTVVPFLKLQVAQAKDNGRVAADVDLGVAALAIPGTADSVFDKKATLAASASVEHDLAGALESPLGDVVSFAKVYAIGVFAEAANTNNVVVGGAAANSFLGPFKDATDKVALTPGGSLLVINPAGWTVTPGTADLLKIANSGAGTSVSYRLVVIGASA